MMELKPRSWQDFQQICCYWMQHLIAEDGGGQHSFQVFGNDGQSQGGVDLIPSDPNLGVVGQSKRWYTKTLNWTEIEKELQKTDDFKGKIRSYIILTTAPRHTSVQLAMPGDKYLHVRANGIGLPVFIFYWDELKNLDFIPTEELRRFFPQVYGLLSSVQQGVVSRQDFTQSLLFARGYLPTLVSQDHLQWLTTWDFNLGYVPAMYFDLFATLSIELVRTRAGLEHAGLRTWLNEGYRIQLSQCLPAAEPVFEAIEQFTMSVTGETVTGTLSDGSIVYGHFHSDISAASRIARTWKSNSEALVTSYREIIEGAPQAV